MPPCMFCNPHEMLEVEAIFSAYERMVKFALEKARCSVLFIYFFVDDPFKSFA